MSEKEKCKLCLHESSIVKTPETSGEGVGGHSDPVYELYIRWRASFRAVGAQLLLSSLQMEETELCFPQLLNASCRRPKPVHDELIVLYILLIFISVLTAILNLLVIISISHFRQRFKLTP
ncbi:uncharacterized protein V6R79_001100 [Siganus canaliculatus]